MKYRVHGYCLIPAEAQIEVEADSEKEALHKAMLEWKNSKCSLIIQNSHGENSAFDWKPTAHTL